MSNVIQMVIQDVVPTLEQTTFRRDRDLLNAILRDPDKLQEQIKSLREINDSERRKGK